jgi:hypothetical protein
MIQLTESELTLADRIARERHNSNRDAGVTDQKIGPQSDYKTDQNGIIGELAVAKRLNVYPDFAIEPSSGGIDLEYEGTTIDVKATEYTGGKLLAPIWKQHKDYADVFALVTIDWPNRDVDGTAPHVEIVGAVRADVLFQDENVINLGHGPTFGMEQSELSSLTDALAQA